MTGASGSKLPASKAMLPYWPTVIPANPTRPCGIIPSAGDRFGSVGIAGNSNVVRTNSAAAAASRWGRLPIPVAMPLDSCARFTLVHPLGDIVPLAVAGTRAEPIIGLTGQTTHESASLGPMNAGGSGLIAALTGTWGPRMIWLAVGIVGAWSIGDALDGRSSAVRTVVAIVGWLAGVSAWSRSSYPRRSVSRSSAWSTRWRAVRPR